FNIQRQRLPGLLQPIDPPSEVFQVRGLDWWGSAPASDAPHVEFKFTRANDHWLHLHNFKTYTNKMARRNVQQQPWAKRYNQNRTDPSFHTGELVWLKVLVGRTKLDEPYRDSYHVVNELGPLNYTFDDGISTATTHVHNLLLAY
ncbi:unnamed protein product, partial [Didymodactylos carnosus]